MKIYDENCRNFREVWEYYRGIRPNNLATPPYRHVLLLIFWIVFGTLFYLLELVIPMDFHAVSSSLDAAIPFCEYFMPAYLYWFPFLIGTLAYTLLFNIEAFKREMYFIMITYTVTLIFYFIYPTKQELRPLTFERENFLVEIVRRFYAFDTNTNVCPSLHVLGSFAAGFAGIQSRRFANWWGRLLMMGSAVLVSASVVFVKQHSIVDVIAALPVVLIGYIIVYYIPYRREKKRQALSSEHEEALTR